MQTLTAPLQAVKKNLVPFAEAMDRDDVVAAQRLWGDAIVEVGDLYLAGGNYEARAKRLLKELYAFDLGPVMFKPTLAADQPFRTKFDDALSYFIGGAIKEDGGFAIKPWNSVRFGRRHISFVEGAALAMGEYFFEPHDEGPEVRVEYTFGYVLDDEGRLRINLHHSSLPYQPEPSADG